MSSKKTPEDTLAGRIRKLSEKSGAHGPAEHERILPAKTKQVASIKRRGERKETFKQGVLIMDTGARVQVIIKNVSENGARVDFVGGTSISGRVQLIEPSIGLNRFAHVIWKDRSSAGLEFEKG